MMDEYMEIYAAEAKELLDEMNDSLLKLEKNMEDTDLINSIFRDAHTIKGNSAAMGFKSMEKLTHGMENILQDIRDGKAEVDGKIMELLFVCHDFLESNLCTIMETGNEEEMKIDEILGKMHFIIGEKYEKQNSGAACTIEKGINSFGMILNKQELQSFKENLNADLGAYIIKITLADDCAFKSVRVWMWFREMENYLNVIKSEPDKPASEDIANSSFTFEGDIVKIFAVSRNDSHELLEELRKLLDTEKIEIESIKFEVADFVKDQIELELTEAALSFPETIEKNQTIGMENEFSDDFINEISAQLSKLEGLIQTAREKHESNSFFKLSRPFHTIKGLAGFINCSLITSIAEAAELLIESYRKKNIKYDDIQVCLITESSGFIRKLCADKNLTHNRNFIDSVEKRTDEMKREVGSEIPIKESQAEEISAKPDPVQEDPKEKKGLNNEKDAVNSLHDQVEKKSNKSKDKTIGNAFMRISTQKIDNLVDMLGELLIMHSVMQQEASKRFDSNDKLMNNLLRMTKIIKGIQNLSMSLRMVSLKQAFQNTMRVGRDTAAELKKKADIQIKGEETEIDRNIADRLVDPLMHLVRNAVAHGIESEEERISNGKSAEGNINIQAYSKKGYIYIEVEDDGKGLPIEKIHAKAIEKNLIDPNSNYSDEEIMKFIFLPGFSTQETIDNISGRGVGMNVVETEIKKVGGKIEISSKLGEGSKFILKIPLNLAVMNGTIVDIHGGRYIIPTLYIKQFMKPDASQWVTIKNRKSMVRVRDELIPIIPIDKVFGTEGLTEGEDEDMVIILEVEQKFRAIPVRSVVGRQEIVAKPLDKEFGSLDYASGASILGDGKISLILDVEAIFKINNNLS